MKADVWFREPVLGMRLIRGEVTDTDLGEVLRIDGLETGSGQLDGYAWGPGDGGDDGAWKSTGVSPIFVPLHMIECLVTG